MSFRFLHSADWHVGKPFGGFESDKGGVLRQARLDVVTTLADVAARHDIAHVLVAGDVFDSPDPGTRLIRELMARLGQFNTITWHLIPGNHDPATRRGVWSTVERLGVPENVVVHRTASPVKIADGVMLLPSPMLSKETDVDPTAWMDAVETPDAMMRIGLAHGGVFGFDTSEDKAGGLISQSRHETARLNYLALGDWHGVKQVNNACWYSGTPEPDKFPRNEPGHALVVEITGPDAAPVVTSIETCKFRWKNTEFVVETPDDLDRLADEISQLGVNAHNHLFNVALSGDVTLAAYTDIEERLDQLAASVFLLERDLKNLRVTTTQTDLDSIGAGDLRRVAERLSKRANENTNAEGARIAMLALQKLFIASRTVSDNMPVDDRAKGQGSTI